MKDNGVSVNELIYKYKWGIEEGNKKWLQLKIGQDKDMNIYLLPTIIFVHAKLKWFHCWTLELAWMKWFVGIRLDLVKIKKI